MDPVRLFIVAVILSLLGLSLQGGLVALGLPVALVPDFVLLFVLFVSFYKSTSYGAFLAFLCGIIVDISSAQLIGPWAGSYVLCFGLVALLSDRIFIESGFSLGVIAISLSLFSQLIFLLISVDPINQLWTEWSIFVGKAFATAFVAPLFFPLIERVLSFSRVDSLRERNRSGYY